MEANMKIAVIGCGSIVSWAHAPAFERMDDVEVTAVCDILPERAAQAAARFGIGPGRVYTRNEELLSDGGFDAVDICTPNALHAVIAVEALNRGYHVFCEKPDAVSVEEALRMQRAAEDSGRVLMVMRNNRFTDTALFLRQYIQAGKMGDIYAGRCGWLRRRGIPGLGGWFTTKALSGGGPLIDLGVHMIDLAVWLMGNPRPTAVSGCTYRQFAGGNAGPETGTFDVEDLAMGFIRFENGACLQIEFSWASNIRRETQFMELRGTRAGAAWGGDAAGGLEIYTQEEGRLCDLLPKSLSGAPPAHERNLRHFADVVLRGAEPVFLPRQGVDMVRILRALYESAECGWEVALSPAEGGLSHDPGSGLE